MPLGCSCCYPTRLSTRPSTSSNIAQKSTAPDGWQNLFDGQSLKGWKQTEFSGGGGVKVVPNFQGGASAIVVEMGSTLSGFNWTNAVPKTNYEISLEALKIDGSDFMCGLTFPVGESYASYILGGWGGATLGISSIDGNDASENETTKFLNFPKNRWFKVRLRVTPTKIEAWIDEEQLVNVETKDRKISMRPGEIENSAPLGLATYQTSSAFRAIKLRRLDAK